MQWNAQVQLPDGAHPPDQLNEDLVNDMPLRHVISRNQEGEPLSYAGDFVWNWTYYTPQKKTSTLNFYYWLTSTVKPPLTQNISSARVKRMRELQRIMLLLIYRQTGRPLAYRTLHIKLGTLSRFARIAEAAGCSVRNLLEQRNLLDRYLIDVPDYEAYRALAWLNFFKELGLNGALGYKLAVPRRLKSFRDRALSRRNNFRQYAPLPTRIYGEVIAALSGELDDIERHKGKLLASLRAAIGKHAIAKKASPEKGVGFGPALIAEHGLQDFLTRRGLPHNLDGLSVLMTDIFQTCKMQIHAFSGMRYEEAKYLPFHCMETVRGLHGKNHSLLVGVTTKLAGGSGHVTRWVTTDADGFRAVRLAQEFSSVIYESCGAVPDQSEDTRNACPLFPSTSHFPWGKRKAPVNGHFAPSKLNFSMVSAGLASRICPVIADEDIEELEEIDPIREWRGEPKFEVGKPWPLTTHQLRRSLALYANASGFVRLTSLRRQLQHITREMAQYYARGSTFANDFLASDPKAYKKHICYEWQDAGLEATYLTFVRDVLNCHEPLHGPAGVFFDRQKQRGEIMQEKELKKQIELGRFTYKDHPLGGCTNTGTCEKVKGLNLLGTVCATEACKNLIGKHSRILQLLPLQRKLLNTLDPNSITYQIEAEELAGLESVEVAWRPEQPQVVAGKGNPNG